MLYLSSFKFHCVKEFWDWTQDCCNVCIGGSTPSGYGEKSPKNAGAARGYCIDYLRETFLNIQNMLGGMEGGKAYKDKTQRKQCKMSSSKKLTRKKTSRQVFIWLRPRTPYPTLFIYCIRVSVYLFTQRGGGGVGEPVRKKKLEGRYCSSREGSKIPSWHDWLYLQSINSITHLKDDI